MQDAEDNPPTRCSGRRSPVALLGPPPSPGAVPGALWICGGEEKAGLLRWGYFWDEIPFLNLIWLHESCRGEGAGRAAMALWEDSLRKAGCRAAMTSTQADEEAQHFYRKLGYRDTGSLILTLPGFEQPTELILIKPLTG